MLQKMHHQSNERTNERFSPKKVLIELVFRRKYFKNFSGLYSVMPKPVTKAATTTTATPKIL